MKKVKTFKCTGFLKPANEPKNTVYEVWGGNFHMELILPNAFKISSFTKLLDKLQKYVKYHSNNYPHSISVSKRQYKQYSELFRGFKLGARATFHGIPLYIRK